jgi:ribulose-5-phosphate 4-epimerase/fuculose-1-phosphate aldolase
VHSHSPYAIALGTLPLGNNRVVPTTNPGSNLGNFIPVFSEVGLIQNPAQGQKVAKSLDGQNGVLLRGHGAVVVGSSIEQAVLRAIYLEMEARTELIARGSRELPIPYTNSESDQFKATRAIEHPWEYYVQKVTRAERAR